MLNEAIIKPGWIMDKQSPFSARLSGPRKVVSQLLSAARLNWGCIVCSRSAILSPMTLAEQIAAMRKSRGLTQAQTADAARINRVYLSQIERSHRVPSAAVVERIAAALGCLVEVRLKPRAR